MKHGFTLYDLRLPPVNARTVGLCQRWSAPYPLRWGAGKSIFGRHNPGPRRTYATAVACTVCGRPIWLKRLSEATRTCNATTWCSNVRAVIVNELRAFSAALYVFQFVVR
mgnify:CR=1 FL=1